MGTTLDEPLYYVNSTCILARTGLRFYLTFTHSLIARQVFGVVVEEVELTTLNIELLGRQPKYCEIPFFFELALFSVFLFAHSASGRPDSCAHHAV